MSAKIFHIPFIKITPQFKLHSIVQRSPKDDNSAPNDYPDLKHCTDAQNMLSDPEVDVIVITTPPDTHFQLTKSALEAGKHVLTEKPFVPSSEEANQLIAIAKKHNRLICVYQNRRWDTDFLTVQHLLKEQRLGRIFEFNTHFDRYKAEAPTTWKGELPLESGGSPLYDLGTHLIDQAYALFGMPDAVRGRLLAQRRGEVDLSRPDAVNAELIYPTGLIVKVSISAMSVEASQPRFWIRGTKGSLTKKGLDPQEDQLKAGMKPTDAGFGKDEEKTMWMSVLDGEGGSGKMKGVEAPEVEPAKYTTLYARFGEAVEKGEEERVPVKASEARDVLRIIEGITESAKGGADVKL